MPEEASNRKHLLFIDDDPLFLGVLKPLLLELSKGEWEIFTAENHAQALDTLQKERLDLVVLDIGMPVMDGIQFLKLLGRSHPGLQVVMLTGAATEEARRTCLEQGAVLFLEKPTSPDGYSEIYSAIRAAASASPQGGFRGMMRRVGLQEVLQLECLGRKSSILEVFTGKVRGQIFICDGAIVHAESGVLSGEMALYNLLALKRGEFNLLQYAEPRERSISGQWEFLLMEAARLSDEAAQSDQPGAQEMTAGSTAVTAPAPSQAQALPTIPDAPIFQRATPAPPPPATSVGSPTPPAIVAKTGPAASSAPPSQTMRSLAPRPDPIPAAPGPPSERHGLAPLPGPAHVQVEEVLLCSGAGEVLYDWQCNPLDKRLRLLQQIELLASAMANIASGRFNRLEIQTPEGRVVCGLQFDMRVFVRTTTTRSAAA
jgi:CheY-like chemotaxis protein